ncbi:MAG: hypothetical protein LLG37_01405 [Spirochaetia bacterium]|nr:hypothetical protein [Spirochaetia bacterium]
MDVDINDLGGIVEAHFNINMPAEKVIEHCRGLNRMAENISARGCVLDVTATAGIVNVFEVFTFVKQIHGCFGCKKVAIVRQGGANENETFCATVAKNRGIPIGAFATTQEAVEWIRQDKKAINN